jgi:hypothetical protein
VSDVTITMSPTVGKLAAALAKAQAEMRPAVKDAQNPHFRNNYATLAACMEAVRPLFAHGIAVIQPPVPHGADGVCVATLLLHESGEWIRGELYMPATKKDAQGFGSALSYARRYCLQATVGLATDDDDGNGAVRGSGDLSGALAASVEANWPSWETKHLHALKKAATVGELQEAWAHATDSAKTLSAPADVFSRLREVKDAQKKALGAPTNGARA